MSARRDHRDPGPDHDAAGDAVRPPDRGAGAQGLPQPAGEEDVTGDHCGIGGKFAEYLDFQSFEKRFISKSCIF